MAYSQEVTLVETRTDIVDATLEEGTAITGMDLYRYGAFCLDVTVNSGSPTLDVAIQAYIGGSWTDIAEFEQVTTTSKRFFRGVGAVEIILFFDPESAQETLTLGAGDMRPGPWGAQIRAIWTTASLGSITWSLKGTVSS